MATSNKQAWKLKEFSAHGANVNSLSLGASEKSGRVLVTGGDDKKINLWAVGKPSCILVWALRTGRMIPELREHTVSVTEVVFHPHEFLLASEVADRRVLFWDLQNFPLVSNSEPETSGIRSIFFHPGGLFSAAQDGLRVYAWEPCQIMDCDPLLWSRIQDMTVTAGQLIGASYNMSHVSVNFVGLEKLAPFGDSSSGTRTVNSSISNSVAGGGGGGVVGGGPTTFRHGQTFRMSLKKERPPGGLRQNDLKMPLEAAQESDDRLSTEPNDDGLIGTADMRDPGHHPNIFQPWGWEYRSLIPPSPDPVKSSPLHRPSPSPSSPYTKLNKTPPQQQSEPCRPLPGTAPGMGGGTTFATTMRERRNSSSPVNTTSIYSSRNITSINSESYHLYPHTPPHLSHTISSSRPGVAYSTGNVSMQPPAGVTIGAQNSRVETLFVVIVTQSIVKIPSKKFTSLVSLIQRIQQKNTEYEAQSVGASA